MTGFLSGQVANIGKKPVLKYLGMEFALIIKHEVQGESLKLGVLIMNVLS
jgi:hypothetical protein